MLLKEFDKAGGEFLYGTAIDAETRSLNAVSGSFHSKILQITTFLNGHLW